MGQVLPIHPARQPRSHVACAACALSHFCFSSVGTEGHVALDSALVSRRRLKSGEVLFNKGEPQRALFAVRAGFLKTCAVLPSGERRILGYHIMGDVLGLDAIGSGVHPSESVALNGCEVCEISVENAERLMAARQPVGIHLRNLLSDEIARAEEHIVALGALSARQKVAGFLLDLGERWGKRGYSALEFDLGLTRREIGSYLGLTFETVSRTLSLFAQQKWLAVDGRQIRILDREALQSQLAKA